MAGGFPKRYPGRMEISTLGTEIWDAKYRQCENSSPVEEDIEATWKRVALAVAAKDPCSPAQNFLDALNGFRFLPGGRVLAGAGSGRQVTLFNCFVGGEIEDSLDGILASLHETAVTMQQGGGIGLDFSTLRPAGTPARRTGRIASGPVTFMHTWDALCRTLLSTSARRGAMMATLACNHPDILEFINAKRDAGALQNFNLSVLVSDAFMRAVERDDQWTLDRGTDPGAGNPSAPSIGAKALWSKLCAAARDTAEPGVLFVDTVNRENNLHYCERITATNPCGEIPLPPYGACDLGSINLVRFVLNPFSRSADLDWQALAEITRTAVRFLDDVIDVSRFPLPQQADQARRTRRTGLGITGLADALAMLGLAYDSDAGRKLATRVMEALRDTAYETSVALARERGAFPLFERDAYLAGSFVSRLPPAIRDAIARDGIRNSHLLAVAPAGTISLLAGNVSSGIEPIYGLQVTRSIRGRDLSVREHVVRDYAYDLWLSSSKQGARLPQGFITADELPARAHLEMQASLQPFVDNAISKTVNLSDAATAADVAAVYEHAYALGIKGCTVFRSGACPAQVIRRTTDKSLKHR